MNINSLSEYNGGSNVVLLSNENPFKKGTLQYVLVEFIIKKHASLGSFSNGHYNKLLLNFLSERKETFHIDSWNGNHLFEAALSLCIVNNIVKINRKFFNRKLFGLFAEDGLFDILSLPQFTNHFKSHKNKDLNPESLKLLWLSLYMNQAIKIKHKVPNISFNHNNFSYTENKYSLNLSNLPYNKIFSANLQIPLAAFSDCWHSEDWIGLNSRGLFHHIGDHVGFYYGANSVGSCFFVGKNQTNHLVTLSANESCRNLAQFTDLHPTDFVYVYGVPKGNPDIFSNPIVISSEEQDCQQNDTKNVIQAEHFWHNPVFMKNTKRKMFAGSLEDKFIDIFNNIQQYLSPEQNAIIAQIIENKTIKLSDLRTHKLWSGDFSDELTNNIINESRFFMKSLAHKTVCELINPVENLELGFFMKHAGSQPVVKRMFVFDLLLSSLAHKQRTIKKPLSVLKEAFIKKFLKEDLEFVKVWSGEGKIGYLFSEIVTMRNEYRMFIINNRVVATSPCFRNTVPLNAWQNGRFDPRLVNGHNDQQTHINRERVAKYAKFARNFCREMKQENPDCRNYVLDVAWCDEKQSVVPIEINSITWSGAYQINMHRVCAATINEKFNYDNLYTYFSDKFYHWDKMIENKIIDAAPFDLCGLDRTLKGNTLPDLESLVARRKLKIEAYNHVGETTEENSDIPVFTPNSAIAEISAILEDDLEDFDDDNLNIFIVDDDDDEVDNCNSNEDNKEK